MVVALYCVATFLCLGQDAAPAKQPVPKVEKSAKGIVKAKLPYPFPGVGIVPVVIGTEDDDTSLLLQIDLPLFWQTLSPDEQKGVKKVPQLIDLVKKRLHAPEVKHEPKTILPSQFV